VRNYTISLSSDQRLGLLGLYDSQTFSTATSALTSSNITDGSSFLTPGYLYTTKVNDGSFFPWEYIISTFTYNTVLNPLKGPYTLTFSTSGLDNSLFGILKVLYDFGDGTKKAVSYPIGDDFSGIALIEAPGDTNVHHDYYPLSLSGTTYTPSVTVINGNLVSFVYNVSATFFPASIYELDDVHLLNSVSLGVSSNQLLNIYETRSPNYVTHALGLSA